MRIKSTKNLKDFWEEHPDAKGSLEAWVYELKHAEWQSSHEVIGVLEKRT